MVKCPYKECGEVFNIRFDESQLTVGETYLMNCPRCGKSIAVDVYEKKMEEIPTVKAETDSIL